jgi:glycosyltransferase involved in cell wall biosynthesis
LSPETTRLDCLDILCFADATWDAPLQTNRQQVMRQLVQHSEAIRVLFVEPPVFAASRKWRSQPGSSLSSRPGLTLSQEYPHLWALKPTSPLPNRILRRYGFPLYQRLLGAAVRSAQQELHFGAPVLWTYSPLAADFLGQLGEVLVCYDCVDDHLATPYYQKQTGADVASLERRLIERADLIFFTSRELQSRKGVSGGRVQLVGNAADVDLFNTAVTRVWEKPADIRDLPAPVIGFFGALVDYKVDFDLLRQTAETHPEWSFVLIGPAEDCQGIARLKAFPNVRLLETKAQFELPRYLAYFDVCMIPYKQNDYTRGLYALKLHEYLSAGKPVVVTDLPCFTEFARLIYIAQDQPQFAAAIAAALDEAQPGVIEERIRVARRHSWANKASLMLRLVIERLAQAGYKTPVS